MEAHAPLLHEVLDRLLLASERLEAWGGKVRPDEDDIEEDEDDDVAAAGGAVWAALSGEARPKAAKAPKA